jgi:hypothetical protein
VNYAAAKEKILREYLKWREFNEISLDVVLPVLENVCLLKVSLANTIVLLKVSLALW